MTRIACVTSLGVCLAAPIAFCPGLRAENTTAERAQALSAQIRPLVTGLLGADAVLPEIIRDGDHFRLEIPLGPTQRVTAALSVSEQGHWALSDLRLPSPSDTTTDIRTPHGTVPLRVETEIAEQSAHAVLDPAFTSPSSLTAHEAGIDARITWPSQVLSLHIAGLGLDVAAQPDAAGRLDVSKHLAGDGIRASLQDGQGDTWAMQAERLLVDAHLDAVARDRVGPTLAALRRLRAAGGDPGAVRDVILALRDIANSGGLAESVEGFRAGGNGQQASADRIALHVDVAEPEGGLVVRVGLATDGAGLEMLPPDVAALLPVHFRLEQSLRGISMGDLTQLALLSTAPHSAEQMQSFVAALFGHGPLTLGLDSLSFDLGPAQVEARGRLLIASPVAAAGAVHVTASGLDALMRQVEKDPLTSLAFPLLVLARGLGRPDGERMVWDVTTEAGTVRVNGTDLGAILGK